MTDETTLVTAQPDGTFEAELSNEPTRVESDSGSWEALDSDLSVVDGHLEPKAALNDVKVSDGGPAGSVIASVERGGTSYAVKSPWALPKPTLDGSLATYVDVLPGVDLVVEITNTGFSHNWVVKNAEAAADPRVRSLTLQTETEGLTPTVSQGSVVYEGADGPAAFTPAPLVWDSSGSGEDDTSASAVQDGPSLSDAVQRVGLSATDDSLTLKTPTKLLDDPQTQFPVVIDPYYVPYTPGRASWAAVWNIYPDYKMFDTSHSLGAGYEGFEQNKKVRTFFQFNTGTVASKTILSASMDVPQVHAAACGSYATKVYRSSGISKDTTWNHQPRQYEYQDSNSSDVGCAHSNDTGNMSWSVITGMKKAAAARNGTATFEVTGPETNRNGWKQFVNDGVKLSIKYIGKPLPPTDFRFGKAEYLTDRCATSGTSAVTFGGDGDGNSTVALNFKARPQSTDAGSKAEPSNLRTSFRIEDEKTGVTDEVLYGVQNKQSNDLTTITWPTSSPVKLVNDGFYKTWVRTRSVYSGDDGVPHTLFSSYAGGCYFKIDTVSPPGPVLTATTGEPICPDPSAAKLSDDPTQVRCVSPNPYLKDNITFRAAPALGAERAKKYRVDIAGVKLPYVTAASDGTATLTIRSVDDSQQVDVWAVDAAGNESVKATSFVFKAETPAAIARWPMEKNPDSDPTPPPSLDNDVANGPALTIPTGDSLSVDGRQHQGLRLGSTTTAAASPTGVADTSGDFSLMSWVNVTSPDAHGTLLSVPGQRGSAVEIDYNDQKWSVRRNVSDQPGAAREYASASSASPAGAWTLMAVTYDVASKTLRLYQNAQLIAKMPLTQAVWKATGAIWVGCRRDEGATNNCLDATVDDVHVWDHRVVTDTQMKIANPSNFDGLPDTQSVGQWAANGASPTGPIPSATHGPSLTLSGGAAVGESSSGDGSTVLKLPGGTSQAATTPGLSVIDSSGSFTVAVRVRLSDLDTNGVVARGTDPSGTDAWAIRYSSTGGGTDDDPLGRWRFVRSNSASDPTFSGIDVPGPDSADALFTLVAVYDAATNSGRFYVNPSIDSRVLSPPTPFNAPPWASTNRIVVGYGSMSDTAAPLKGEVTSVDIYAGAMDVDTVVAKFPTPSSSGTF